LSTRIRLKRCGAKKQPYYRVVVVDQRKTRDGKTVEELGAYNPHTDPCTVNVKKDRCVHWLMTGAQPSETVASLFRRIGVLEAVAAAKAAQSAPAAAE
jgi:small subunit ribosomal protein S16